MLATIVDTKEREGLTRAKGKGLKIVRVQLSDVLILTLHVLQPLIQVSPGRQINRPLTKKEVLVAGLHSIFQMPQQPDDHTFG